MIQSDRPNFRTVLRARGLLAGCAQLLSACAVSTPLTITSVGDESAQRPAQIAIAMPDDDLSLKARFAGALAQAFDRQGISVADEGVLVADYAVSIGSAEMGLRGGAPGTGNETSEDDDGWIAISREPRRFDQCEAQMMRGTLLLLDRTDGSLAYRGQGMAIECDFDDADWRALADQLVADFISQR